MKTKLLAGVAVAAMIAGCGSDIPKLGNSTLVEDTISSAGANNSYLVIKNSTGATIDANATYVSLTSSNTWPTASSYTSSISNQKASTNIDTASVSGCTKNVDLRVDMPDGNRTIKYNVKLECGKTYNWTISAF